MAAAPGTFRTVMLQRQEQTLNTRQEGHVPVPFLQDEKNELTKNA
jgi:hypothetical protein